MIIDNVSAAVTSPPSTAEALRLGETFIG